MSKRSSTMIKMESSIIGATEIPGLSLQVANAPHGVRIVDRMTMLSDSWATMFLADQKISADPVFFDRF
jgi:hypothetical protein